MSELLTTTDAAKGLGISARSLSRWAKEGILTPALVTPGGHYRWDVDDLRAQLTAQRLHDE